ELLLDFNHPLVGFDLHFEGMVLEVREATKDELAHGHVHDATKDAE
ncbi:MAG: FKBP-type peptidyl-prolyl cis-trans isomerase SlyD, partial [Algoriphagus sp.]